MQENRHQVLLNTVEHKIGRKLLTSRDFDFLSKEIQHATGTQISISTLKRLWGYISTKSGYQPHLYTLNSLASFIGYKDYATFIQREQDSASSDFIDKPHLFSSQLMPGDIITLRWQPDRVVEIKFLGQDMFAVTRSVNSKLDAGDTFSVGCFINDYPLIITRLLHSDMPPMSYICGKDGGIRYELHCHEQPSAWGGGNTKDWYSTY